MSDPARDPERTPHAARAGASAPRPSGRDRERAVYAQYAGLGLQYALTILVFAALGWWLDRKLGTSPWLLIAFVFLGFFGGLVSLVSKVGAPSRRGDAERGDPPPPGSEG